MSVGQVVQQFGLPNCSGGERPLRPRNNWTPGAVIHIIEPREVRGHDEEGPQEHALRVDLRFEPGSNEGKWLRESGFKRFPRCARAGW